MDFGKEGTPWDSILSFGTPKYEVRAVWLTTMGGLDWPHSYSQSVRSMEKQQEELKNILDQLKKANINTVIIQTRIRGTVIYPSGYEP
ncbi:MAG: family 10 glycosylhydrolase, partial [Prevotella sp.]